MRWLAVFAVIPALLAAQPPADPRALVEQAKALVLEPGGRLQAEALLRQAVEVFEKQAPKSDDYAGALTLLAMTLHPSFSANREALETQVEPLAHKALEIRQQDPNVKPADLALDLELEAMILEEMGRLEDSRDPKAKARGLRDQIITAMQTPFDDLSPEHMGNPGVLPPRLVSRAEPELTFAARVLKLVPEVMVELIIGTDGACHSIEIFRPAGFGLDEKAVEALQKWRFLSAQKAGIPVSVEGTVRLKFRPPGNLLQ